MLYIQKELRQKCVRKQMCEGFSFLFALKEFIFCIEKSR